MFEAKPKEVLEQISQNINFLLIYFIYINKFCIFASINLNEAKQAIIITKNNMLMKKILLSLISVLFAVCANAQVTFDFDNDYQKYFPELPGVSSGSNATYVADGELNGDAVVSIDGVTVTIKASAADAATRNRIWATSPRLRMYNESFTIAAAGHKITKIEFFAHSTNFNISTAVGTLSADKVWYGSEESVVFAVAKNTQIKSIVVTVDGEQETPEQPVDITNTPATAYTTSQAYDLIKADKGLDKAVYVKGTITKVDEISLEYGNATYYITDGVKELEIYRGFGLGGEKFTSVDDIQDGDDVVVYGKLVDYKGTYEMTTGSKIYSLNGKIADETPDTPVTPEEPYTVVGAGTLDNPYTIEDVIKGVYNAEQTVEGVWVKGVILGCFGSEKEPISAKDPVASNIALGTEDKAFVIPVQLIANNTTGDSPARKAINIVDNPENVGKTVWIYGNIEKYFSVAGVKGTSDWSWDGQTSSVELIKASSMSTRNAIFSISGAKLNNAPVKGVYIIDGKKKVVK